IPSVSVATTSRLTGPSTIRQISSTRSRNCRFSLATSEGLVVQPSRRPIAVASLSSFTLPVSRKIFMPCALRPSSARTPGRSALRLSMGDGRRGGLSRFHPLETHPSASPHSLEHRGVALDAPQDVHRARAPAPPPPPRRPPP